MDLNFLSVGYICLRCHQCFITYIYIGCRQTTWLDGKHCVFGYVSKGMNVIKGIEALGTASGQPIARISVLEAGQLYPPVEPEK